jgi:hypothetical protein
MAHKKHAFPDSIPPEVIAAVAEVAAAPAPVLPSDEAIKQAVAEAGEPAPRPVFKRIGGQSWVEEIDQQTGDLVRRYPQGEEP